MKKAVSMILFLSILFSCSFAIAIDWDKAFDDIRPSEEVEIIETFMDIVTETYTSDNEVKQVFDLTLDYFSNVDIVCAVLTLKHVSKDDLNKAELEALQNELEPAMIHLRDSWYESLETLGITGTRITIFCNTNDFDVQRVAEIWWNDQTP